MTDRHRTKNQAFLLEFPVGMRLDEIDRLAIAAMLRWCGKNKSRTARGLGISRKTLYNKLKKYNL